MLALQLDYHIKEEVRVKYLNAQAILPNALVKELQTYVQGGYIYVPVDQEHQKCWGEVSGYRQELAQRNQQIKEEYQRGISIESLSEKYCLSLYAVRKIIYQK
jgi:Mor family transcriptional regulator